MNNELMIQFDINPFRPLQYPTIDIQPIFIRYWLAILIISILNLFVLYKFSYQVWKIYQQSNTQNILHDIYDKNILCLSIKYILLNIMCILYFHDITNPPIQIIKMFWIYYITIVFMKFDIKQIFYPAFILFIVLILISIISIKLWQIFPVFKLILIQSIIILYYGIGQILKINKILKTYLSTQNQQISIQTLLQKHKPNKYNNQYDQFTMQLELDQQIIGHLQNRRSFCVLFSIILIFNLILYLNLQAAKQLFGQVLLSLILHTLPLYIIFWYLKKSVHQKEVQQLQQKSEVSRNNYNQTNSRRTSKIIIEMVDVKK